MKLTKEESQKGVITSPQKGEINVQKGAGDGTVSNRNSRDEVACDVHGLLQICHPDNARAIATRHHKEYPKCTITVKMVR